LAILARNNPFATFFRPLKKKDVMKISDYLDPQLVVFLTAESRDTAIETLVDRLDAEGKLEDKKVFRDAILYREGLVSTGIGMGIAIPHAKMKNIEQFFIVVGLQQAHGIEWNSLDKVPVRIIFMIGGPDDKQTEYLQILSMLTSAIRSVDLRKKLLKATTSTEVVDLFINALP